MDDVLDGPEKISEKHLTRTFEMICLLANTYFGQGECDFAEKLLLEAREGSSKLFLGLEHRPTFNAVYYLALTLSIRGDWPKLEHIYQDSLDIYLRVLEPDNPITIDCMQRLGVAMLFNRFESKAYAAAVEYNYEVLERTRRVFGTRSPRTLAFMIILSGNLSFEGTHKEQTLELAEEARFLAESIFGAGSWFALDAIYTIGLILRAQGKFQEAKEKLLFVLENYLATYGEHHPRTVDVYGGIADTLSGLGFYKEAEGYYVRAIAGYKRLYGTHAISCNARTDGLGIALYHQFLYKSAEEKFYTASTETEALRPDTKDSMDAKRHLSSALLNQDQYVQAEAIQRHVLATANRLFDLCNYRSGEIKYCLGITLRYQRALDESEQLLREALRCFRVGEEDEYILGTKYNLGLTLWEAGKYIEAEEILVGLPAEHIDHYGPEHRYTLAVRKSVEEMPQKKLEGKPLSGGLARHMAILNEI